MVRSYEDLIKRAKETNNPLLMDLVETAYSWKSQPVLTPVQRATTTGGVTKLNVVQGTGSGVKGDKGDKGEDGIDGINGADGKDGTKTAGVTGEPLGEITFFNPYA